MNGHSELDARSGEGRASDVSKISRIGVVIPAYNAGPWLKRTLDSVAASADFVPFEVVAIDDGSTDDTAVIGEAYAAADSRFRLVRKENGGPGSARNRGFQELSPEVDAVMFLDADDELEPDALGKLRRALEASPRAVAVYGAARYIGRNSERIRAGQAEGWHYDRHRVDGDQLTPCAPDEPSTFEVMAVRNAITTPGQALIRRSLFTQLGGFDTQLRGHEDWHFWVRATLVGELQPIHEVLLNYRDHGSAQISKNARKMRRDRRLALEKLSRELPPERAACLSEGQRLSHRLLGQYWAGWALDSFKAGKLVTAANQARHAAQEHVEYAIESSRDPISAMKRALLELSNSRSAETLDSEISDTGTGRR